MVRINSKREQSGGKFQAASHRVAAGVIVERGSPPGGHVESFLSGLFDEDHRRGPFGRYPAQSSTGSRGYFGKAGSTLESSHR